MHESVKTDYVAEDPNIAPTWGAAFSAQHAKHSQVAQALHFPRASTTTFFVRLMSRAHVVATLEPAHLQYYRVIVLWETPPPPSRSSVPGTFLSCSLTAIVGGGALEPVNDGVSVDRCRRETIKSQGDITRRAISDVIAMFSRDNVVFSHAHF